MKRAGSKAKEPPEQDLVERSREGDRDAFGALVGKYQSDVLGLAQRIVGNYHDACEIAQEAFVKAFLGIARFRGDSSFRTWLYTIVINLSRNHLKVRGRQRKRFESLDEENPWEEGLPRRQVASGNPGPDMEAERGELREQLQRAIGLLPLEQREVIVLRDVDGLSYEEVARTVRCSTGTVKSRLHRARCQMQVHLGSMLKDEV